MVSRRKQRHQSSPPKNQQLVGERDPTGTPHCASFYEYAAAKALPAQHPVLGVQEPPIVTRYQLLFSGAFQPSSN
ncbi:hypothetical protein DTO271D3_6964 [Paecilomyces variotii]|nr:hypothetical protein DTO169C6_8996 [Paecilomyces variotii]KAJ9312730.1 hypothetical protein DTO271D3_6964 [Paecilomyces variotii]